MKALVTDSLVEAFGDADVVIVTTTDQADVGLDAETLLQGRDKVTLVDFLRCLKPPGNDPRIRYVPIGLFIDDEQATSRLQSQWS